MTREIDPIQLERMAREAIPPKRSFIVRRWKQEFVSVGITAPRLIETRDNLVEFVVEAHSYGTQPCGALAFNTYEFIKAGKQGPGVYEQCSLLLAPGTFYDVREATHDLKTRQAAS